jgi:glycerol-3-phosphate dehydrogenase
MDSTTALTVPAEARFALRIAVVGAGRLGTALSAALARMNLDVERPLTRDEATVARQRAAVAERAPEELELFDALADATRRPAAQRMASG